MIKLEDKILIANDIIGKLNIFKIKILSHLLKLCPVIGYDENSGKPIRKSCKLSTRELCDTLKISKPIMLRELRELEDEGFIYRKHRIGKTKEIYILNFPAD